MANQLLDVGRLAAVARTGLLDTVPDEPFDRLARLAAALLDAPLAFVTIVDDTRSYWKSAIGIDEIGIVDRNQAIPDSFCQYIVASGERLIVDDAAHDPRTRDNPSVRKHGVAAWAGFPLIAPTGEVLGSFCVVDMRTRRWSLQDVHVLQTLSAAATGEVALRMALHDERGARRRADLEAARSAALARSLQASLLPPELPHVPGLEVAARYLPADGGSEVVGDFFDVFQRGPDTWGFMIGDVAGKGVEAAKLATLARHTIRTAAMQRLSPREILLTLNRAMLEQDPDSDRFVTAIYGTLELTANGVEIELAVAGHPTPLVRRSDRTLETTDSHGTLLGALAEPILSDESIRLEAGDVLVLYTDGVTEARARGSLFGEERLRALVAGGAAGAEELASEIEGAVRAFSPALADDTAILILRPSEG
ncbi:MAG: phosphoserine phosphatase RsbU/P [Gaiellales bacterium]|jgi:serine phosphatase RsbU (regulator of sigma subunit)|nr:phosphoserine phosphatase RsbU/P [Gaiellales bacterium]